MEGKDGHKFGKDRLPKAEVMFSGHDIRHGQVTPRNVKTKAIEEFPTPFLKLEVLRFLGLSGFCTRFVPNFNSMVGPLMDLLNKMMKFLWTDECQEASDNLKAALTTTAVLAMPNFLKPLPVAID
eukprot:g24594.t1